MIFKNLSNSIVLRTTFIPKILPYNILTYCILAIYFCGIPNFLFSQAPILNITTSPETDIVGLDFSPDGTLLASIEADGTIELWDMTSFRKIRTFLPEIVEAHNLIAFSKDGKWIISGGSNAHHITLRNIDPDSYDYNKAVVNSIIRKSFYSGYPLGAQKNYIPFNDDFIVLTDKKIFLLSTNNKMITEIYKFSEKEGYIIGGCISEDKKTLFLNLGGILAPNKRRTSSQLFYSDLDTTQNKLDINLVKGPRTVNGKNMTSVNEKLYIMDNYGNHYRIDLDKKNIPIGKCKYITETTSAYLWDKLDSCNFSNLTYSTHHGIISVAGKTITEHNYNGKILRKYPSLPKKITAYATIKNTLDLLAVADKSGQIYLFNTISGKLINTFIQPSPKATSFLYSSDLNYLFIGYSDGIIKRWNLKENSIRIVSVSTESKLGIRNSPDIFISSIDSVSDNRELYFKYERFPGKHHESWAGKWDTRTNQIQSSLYSSHKKIDSERQNFSDLINPLDSAAESRKNMSNFKDPKLRLSYSGELMTSKRRVPVPNHFRVTDAQYLNGTSSLAALTMEGNILLFDTTNLEPIGNMGISGERGFYYFINNNYYFASKEALRSMSYSINNQAIPIEQFDYYFNRPDLVMEQMPFADSTLISLYRRALTKRKISYENFNIDSYEIPTVNLVVPLPIETNQNEIQAQFKAKGSGTVLDKIILSTNGIILYEINNINKIDTIISFNISLNAGKNLISIEAINKKGIKSIRNEYLIINQTRYKQNTYVVSIGAGIYNEQKYNLDYAAKDAKDLTVYFKKQRNTKTLCITDTEVNTNLMERIKSFLSTADIHDRIYVFYSGHGLLNAKLDYFLSTYQVDFNNPDHGGIKYEDLVNLLENIPSRQKVLFLDACHSGEIDKEYTSLDTISQANDEDIVVFRSSVKAVASDAQSQESFELARMLFIDAGLTKGLSVVSSAGGTEFALEGSKWKNGVFTYALLKGLKESLADLNGDRNIYLSELQYYLYETVKNLTQGNQSPSGRIENLKNDFEMK